MCVLIVPELGEELNLVLPSMRDLLALHGLSEPFLLDLAPPPILFALAPHSEQLELLAHGFAVELLEARLADVASER
eukprot:13176149-Alexandrium_andersonii.AAC.1